MWAYQNIHTNIDIIIVNKFTWTSEASSLGRELLVCRSFLWQLWQCGASGFLRKPRSSSMPGGRQRTWMQQSWERTGSCCRSVNPSPPSPILCRLSERGGNSSPAHSAERPEPSLKSSSWSNTCQMIINVTTACSVWFLRQQNDNIKVIVWHFLWW